MIPITFLSFINSIFRPFSKALGKERKGEKGMVRGGEGRAGQSRAGQGRAGQLPLETSYQMDDVS